jgi:hypothetical protein
MGMWEVTIIFSIISHFLYYIRILLFSQARQRLMKKPQRVDKVKTMRASPSYSYKGFTLDPPKTA